MPDDVLLNKVATVERCLGRIHDEYLGREDEFESNQTRQDAIILNLLRACEACIDLAMHRVRKQDLGLPQGSRHAFVLLYEAGVLDAALCERMQAMVGFRNIAVHDYQALSLPVVRSILDYRLVDFRRFVQVVMTQTDA